MAARLALSNVYSNYRTHLLRLAKNSNYSTEDAEDLLSYTLISLLARPDLRVDGLVSLLTKSFTLSLKSGNRRIHGNYHKHTRPLGDLVLIDSATPQDQLIALENIRTRQKAPKDILLDKLNDKGWSPTVKDRKLYDAFYNITTLGRHGYDAAFTAQAKAIRPDWFPREVLCLSTGQIFSSPQEAATLNNVRTKAIIDSINGKKGHWVYL